jgi:hypothetical protein
MKMQLEILCENPAIIFCSFFDGGELCLGTERCCL